MSSGIELTSAVPGEEDIAEVFIIGSAFEGDDGALQQIDGFEWIEFGSDDPAQDAEMVNMRIEAAKLTAAACRLGSYCYNEMELPLVNLPQCLEGTHVILKVDGATAAEHEFATEFHEHTDDDSFSEVLLQVATERKVTVLTAGSPYKIGGNFVDGGIVGLEEMLCMQSTLHFSLRRAANMAEQHGVAVPRTARPVQGLAQAYIPEHGAILSPNIEVFRGGPEYGFPFLASPCLLGAVVTVAMPNCNPDLVDEPFDAPENVEDYCSLLRVKIAAALEVAVAIKTQTLVVPYLGCGRFQNDPGTVGKLFVETFLNGFSTAFAEVHIYGNDDFLMACSVLSALGQAQQPEPQTSPSAFRMRERRGAVDSADLDPFQPSPQSAPELVQGSGLSRHSLESETLLDPDERATQLDSEFLGMETSQRQVLRAEHAESAPFSKLAQDPATRPHSEETLRDKRFQSLKAAVREVASQHAASIDSLAATLSSWTEQSFQDERVALKSESIQIRDQAEQLDMQRRELSQRQEELAATREQLLQQIEETRNAAPGGCLLS